MAYSLREFDIRLAPGQPKEPIIDRYIIPLRPMGGIRVTLHKRK